jgi:hypothetical protein
MPAGSRSSGRGNGKGSSNAKKSLATGTAAAPAVDSVDIGSAAETPDCAEVSRSNIAESGNEVEEGRPAGSALVPATQPHAGSPAACNDEGSSAAAAAAAPAAGSAAAEEAEREEGAGLNFSLDELVAIIMDVMHSKQEEDNR